MNYQSKQLFQTYSTAVLLILAASMSFTACLPKNVAVIRIPTDTANFSSVAKELVAINHLTAASTIEAYKTSFGTVKTAFQKANLGVVIPTGESFNKKDLIKILQQPDCIGIRIYYGAKSTNDQSTTRFVIVGVGKKGEDLFLTVDGAAIHPPDKSRVTPSGGGRGPKIAANNPSDFGPSSERAGLQHGQCIDPPCKN